MSDATPVVGVVMGSTSDSAVMAKAVEVLERFAIAHEWRVVSAHRTPDDMLEYGRSAADRGLKVIIAGAGGAAHLPGMLASMTTLPVIGVPISATKLAGVDALLSIAEMPSGVPVATMAVDGAANAGLLAARILGISDVTLSAAIADDADARAHAARTSEPSRPASPA